MRSNGRKCIEAVGEQFDAQSNPVRWIPRPTPISHFYVKPNIKYKNEIQTPMRADGRTEANGKQFFSHWNTNPCGSIWNLQTLRNWILTHQREPKQNFGSFRHLAWQKWKRCWPNLHFLKHDDNCTVSAKSILLFCLRLSHWRVQGAGDMLKCVAAMQFQFVHGTLLFF